MQGFKNRLPRHFGGLQRTGSLRQRIHLERKDTEIQGKRVAPCPPHPRAQSRAIPARRAVPARQQRSSWDSSSPRSDPGDTELQEADMYEYLWNIIQRHMAEMLKHLGKKWLSGILENKAEDKRRPSVTLWQRDNFLRESSCVCRMWSV